MVRGEGDVGTIQSSRPAVSRMIGSFLFLIFFYFFWLTGGYCTEGKV